MRARAQPHVVRVTTGSLIVFPCDRYVQREKVSCTSKWKTKPKKQEKTCHSQSDSLFHPLPMHEACDLIGYCPPCLTKLPASSRHSRGDDIISDRLHQCRTYTELNHLPLCTPAPFHCSVVRGLSTPVTTRHCGRISVLSCVGWLVVVVALVIKFVCFFSLLA